MTAGELFLLFFICNAQCCDAENQPVNSVVDVNQ